MFGSKITKALRGLAVLSSTFLLMGMFAGTAFSKYVAEHENIVLNGADGTPVTSLTGADNAYSSKKTCGGCHTYNKIEQHSYHAQLAANEHYGWNPMNPDGDKWESGPGPKGKAWVQGQGHVGAW